MAGLRKLPIGIQSFEVLRRENYVYVDKTQYIWDLIQTGRVYFLSRPRRFGKSLLISTIEAYFRGQKELFRGLAIEKLENERGKDAWQAYPVIHFALSGGDYQSSEGLELTLHGVLKRYEGEYGIDPDGLDLPNRFRQLIEGIYKASGKPVVILVDEYDKPLLETMTVNEEQEERNRLLYKGFFSVLKDEDARLKFVFFTGVTKFSKISIFSDLNQLNDISMDDEESGICGITEEELRLNFAPEIEALARAQDLSSEECLTKLAEEYDGYHFSKAGRGVYNPFSLLNAFSKKEFGRYWFETATPTFVVRKLLHSDFTPEQVVDGVVAAEDSLKQYRGDDPNPIPLLYQSGYLTIAGFDRRFRLYTLKFPNNEVKYGFMESLVPMVLGDRDAERPMTFAQMVLALEKGDLNSFMTKMKVIFSRIPYYEGQRPSYEQEWRNEVYLILIMLGENADCEPHSAEGRADCVVRTDRFVYIFEFKLDKSADEALRQIEERGYADPYRDDPRKVYKVGVNFSTEKRNILEWKAALVTG